MLMAHPALLPGLVERYWSLSVLEAAEAEGSPVHEQLCDVARALCVATGTSSVDAALVAARHNLPGAGPLDDSLLARTPASGEPVTA
ncbi:hypothetical protein AMK16_21940 [Streptomyces sp. CB00455]|uniref:DUF5133 domain-containing protein n=1 Tax=Streptomyces sp. CB00455 TaxID=1703927 RepID=UPI00093BBFF6|nr:DUF5133 domain-containing protein [Streptomyces sp. CB00455]OKK17484.1 hypothetical protein AMK16_21940 [Streptomyces sp. CB00455]